MQTPADAADDERESFRDELGVRSRRPDATGVPTEVLRVCRDLASVSRAIADRFERLVTLRLAHFVPLRGVGTPADDSFGFEVVSDAPDGVRLSTLLAAARSGRLAIPSDTALHIFRQLLAAVAALHESRGIAHGAIAPERILIAPRGHIILTDFVYGSAFERLGLSRARLWREFRIATPPRPAGPALDAQADVGQVGLVALALLGGRPLDVSDYPDRVPSLLDALMMDAAKGPAAPLNKAMRTWMNGMLPVGTGIRFATARNAQMALEAALDARRSPAGAENPLKALLREYERAAAAPGSSHGPGAPPDKRRLCQAPFVAARIAGPHGTWDPDTDGPSESVIQLLAESHRDAEARVTQTPDGSSAALGSDEGEAVTLVDARVILPDELPSADVLVPCAVRTLAEEIAEYPPAPVCATAETAGARLKSIPEEIEESGPPPTPAPLFGAPLMAPNAELEPAPPQEQPAAGAIPGCPGRADEREPIGAVAAVGGTPVLSPPVAGPTVSPVYHHQRPVRRHGLSVRRVGQRLARQTRDVASGTSRAARRAGFGGWALVTGGGRALVAGARVTITWIVGLLRTASALAVLGYAIALRAGRGLLAGVGRLVRAGALIAWRGAHRAARMSDRAMRSGFALTARGVLAAGRGALAAGRFAVRAGRFAVSACRAASCAGVLLAARAMTSARRAAAGVRGLQLPPQSARVWRLAGGILVVLVVSSVLRYADSQWLVRARTLAGRLSAATGTSELAVPPVVAPSVTGAIRIVTQPDGAAVWVDGVARGRAPLDLTGLSEGDHSLVMRGEAGSVRTSVRVRAGETQQVLVPIYPGWLAVFAPVELQVTEGGVVIGTTESGRLMAAPGPHTLELTSASLGFRTTRMVEVKPGAVAAVNVTLPPAPLEITAPSGSEVWIDGTFMGTAPVPPLPVAVGTRAVVVRHPVLGEQRTTVTVSYRGSNHVVFDDLP